MATRIVLLAFAMIVTGGTRATAQYTWNGTTGNWDNAANWFGGLQPTGTNLDDILTFGGSGASSYTATLDYPFPKFQLRTLSLNSSSTGGQTIDQTGGRYFEVKNLTSTNFNNIDQLGTGAFTVVADFEIAGGAGGNFKVGGNGAGRLTLSGVLNPSNSGGFNLLKTGTSTLVLSGTNKITGSLTVAGAGVLEVASAANLAGSSYSLILEAGATLRTAGSFTLTRPVFLGVGNGTVDTNGNNLDISSFVYGTNQLIKNGTGKLTLSGSNRFGYYDTGTGNTIGAVVNAGTLAAGSDASLGTSLAQVHLNNSSTLQASGPFSTPRTIALNSHTTTVDTNGFDVTFSGYVNGGTLTKIGAGTLSLTSSNNFTGNGAAAPGLFVNEGTVAFTRESPTDGSLGAPGKGVSLNNGTLRALTPAQSFHQTYRPITVTGNSTLDNGGYRWDVGSPGVTNTISGSGTLTLTGAGTFSLPKVTGSLGLTVTGGGTVSLLNETSNFTGTVTLLGGTTLSTYNTALAGLGGVVFGGGVLGFNSGVTNQTTFNRPATAIAGQNYRFVNVFKIDSVLNDPVGGGSAGLDVLAGTSYSPTLNSVSGFSGPTTIAPLAVLTLGSTGGSIANSVSVTVGRNGAFIVDRSGTNTQRLKTGANVNLDGASWKFSSKPGEVSTENPGTLTLGFGRNLIDFNPGGGQGASVLNFSALATLPTSTVLEVNAIYLGGLGGSGNNSGMLKFGGVTNGTFLPQMVKTGNANLGTTNPTLVEYITTTGVTPIFPNAVFNTINSAPANQHVFPILSTANLTSNFTARTLSLGATNVDLGGFTLTLSNGVLLRSGGTEGTGGTSASISNGTLTTGGSTPLRVYAYDDFSLTANIAASQTGGVFYFVNAGRTVSVGGTGSYTGGTTLLGNSTLTSTVKLLTGTAFPSGGAVTVGAGSTLDLAGIAVSLGTVTLEAGGTITSSSGSTALFASTFVNRGGTLSIPLGGSTQLTVDNGGTVTLSQISGHTGGTKVQSGTAIVTNGGAVGSGITEVVSGATIQLGTGSGFSFPNSVPLTIAGTGSGQGALVNAGGSATIGGTIVLNDNATIYNPVGSTLNLNGTITKNGRVLSILGGGIVKINGQVTGALPNSDLAIVGGTIAELNVASDYNGPTYVTGNSTLKLGVANAIPAGSVVSLGDLNGPGTLDLVSTPQTIGGLNTGVGTTGSQVLNTAGGMPTLTINQVTNQTFAGQLGGGTFAAPTQNGFGLTKEGSGSLTISGVGTYSGPTAVNAGTLVLNGAIQSNVTVGAVLKGSGSTTGTLHVNNGGVLSPGNSPGTLSAGSTTIASGGQFAIELAQASTDFKAVGTSDLLIVTGTLTLANGSAVYVDTTTFVPGGVSAFINGNTYQYTIASTTAGVIGNLSQVSVTGNSPGIYGLGLVNSGNDLALSYTPVPEPGFVVFLFAGATVAFWRRVRRPTSTTRFEV